MKRPKKISKKMKNWFKNKKKMMELEGLESIKIYGETSNSPICEITLRTDENHISGFDCLNESCMMLESLGVFQNVNVQLMELRSFDGSVVVKKQDMLEPGASLRLYSIKGKSVQRVDILSKL